MITDQTCEPLVTDPGWCWAVRFADGTVLVHRSLLTDRVPDVLAPVRDAVHGLVLVMSEEEPPTPDMFGRTVWEWWCPGPREP